MGGSHITLPPTPAPKLKQMTKETKEKAEVSKEKAAFAALVESYKIQNPVKYEQKKAAFEKKLASL